MRWGRSWAYLIHGRIEERRCRFHVLAAKDGVDHLSLFLVKITYDDIELSSSP